jgi:type I restriction enzyme S subunit
MKESGVEWIGEIPEHWEVKALKHIAVLKSGETISPDDFIDDESGFPVFGGNGFRGYTSTFTNEGKFALIGRQGALCGNVNYATGKFYASEHAIVVYPLNGENVIWIGEAIKLANFNRLSQSAAQPGISVNVVKNIFFPYPPFKEQIEISEQIEGLTNKIAKAISLKEQEIEKLIEYKATLINSVVTGKIKVYNDAE